MRCKTIEQLGYTVMPLNPDPYILNSVFTKLQYHFSIGPGVLRLNRKICSLLQQQAFDVVLVDNKSYLLSSTLKYIRKKYPAATICNILTDDPFGRYRKSWGLTRKTAAFFDIHFVQRRQNKAELLAAGARQVEFCFRSFDPSFHRPVELSTGDKIKYGTAVGFVGSYEEHREAAVAQLIQQGIPVAVTGNDWQKGKYWNIIQSFYKGPSVYGEAYIKTINGMDIALHFLRRGNRDEQDSRSFEIPACRVFMLAEHSYLHELFFEEDKEAVFFNNSDELAGKINYYLQHPAQRQAIAAAGYQRCLSSGYSHQERLREVFKIIAAHKAQ